MKILDPVMPVMGGTAVAAPAHAPADVPASAREAIIEKFGSPDAARKYAASLEGTPKNKRELRCIQRALEGLPAGATVLDQPCGAGRLLPMLLASGYRVHSSDSSPHMVDFARKRATECGGDMNELGFSVADALHMPFEDNQFDAVICNRLAHHFPEQALRRELLRELARVSRDRVVLSFFCHWSFDALDWYARAISRRLSGKATGRLGETDRRPIGIATMRSDARAAGLEVTKWLPTRPGVSMQWFIELRPARSG